MTSKLIILAVIFIGCCADYGSPQPITLTVENPSVQPAFVVFADGLTRTVDRADTVRYTVTSQTVVVYYDGDTTHVSVDRPTTYNVLTKKVQR